MPDEQDKNNSTTQPEPTQSPVVEQPVSQPNTQPEQIDAAAPQIPPNQYAQPPHANVPQPGVQGAKINVLALVGFILAIVGALIFILPYVGLPLCVAALILCIIGLVKIKHSSGQQKGIGFAVAGMAISIVGVVVQSILATIVIIALVLVNSPEVKTCVDQVNHIMDFGQKYGSSMYSDSFLQQGRDNAQSNCTDSTYRENVSSVYDKVKTVEDALDQYSGSDASYMKTVDTSVLNSINGLVSK